MKNLKSSISFFSVGLFLLFTFYLTPLNNKNVTEPVVVQEIEEDLSHCDAPFSSVYWFCPGSYQFSGYLSVANGCTFTWLGSANCQGITANASQNGNWITISGTGTAGAFCKFRYRITDDHGGSWTYLVGVRIYEEDHPLCCTSGPCI